MELLQHLTEELGVSARQALGGAGLLLGLAQQRLDDQQFQRLAETIPAISDVISKAPRTDALAGRNLWQTVSRWLGGLGGLLAVVDGFHTLGCDKTMLGNFADALVEFFRRRSGEDVAELLKGALR